MNNMISPDIEKANIFELHSDSLNLSETGSRYIMYQGFDILDKS